MIHLGLTEALYTMPRGEKRALNPRDEVFAEWAAANGSSAGPVVTQNSAKSLSAYWNGVTVIAGDIGALDRHIYRRVGEDDRERATSQPAYRLVHDQPNPQATGMVFWETFTSHIVSWGNGYAEIEWDNAGRPIGLWLITPDKIEPKLELVRDRRGRTSQRVYYLYKGQTRLEAADVLHVPGLGFDGIRGYSPVALARQSMSLSISMEEFGSSYYGNGAWAGVALQHPKTLTDTGIKHLRESFEERHRGAGNAFKPIILEDGMVVSKPVTIPPGDAQFLEGRSFQIEEIARWLNLQPHKLKHKVNERPGGNLESSEIDHQVTTLMPITKRIEQECDRKLLGGQRQYYTEHNFASRLKTDTKTRTEAYKVYSDLHVLDAEQIARMENLPRPKPRPAPEPPPTQAPVAAPAPAPPPPTRDGARVAAARRALLLSVVGRYMRREAEKARRAADRGTQSFGAWASTFYEGDERSVLVESITPAVAMCIAAAGSDVDPGGVAEGFAARYMSRSREEMESMPPTGAAVAALLKRWESSRAMESVEELIAACEAAEEKEHVA